ncbi:uncharacterized protein K489DRAFT_418785 [Dissoconium aciculare CBS 342.82]|uniref:Uncharacterized protein n=1 Tax=Dissoconium aciculare CBS 342.82 TaxID=1314786 RepID=A0A6J3LT05_9PEZI|nr:uncharacterized protein K489DRAFT_418785 [Dissoconium aciculare CBS 342.82]KAF1818419.1 hypothetical protein K489DRAFT_418785 [Dissoconium aciculare CBS 342.82]
MSTGHILQVIAETVQGAERQQRYSHLLLLTMPRVQQSFPSLVSGCPGKDHNSWSAGRSPAHSNTNTVQNTNTDACAGQQTAHDKHARHHRSSIACTVPPEQRDDGEWNATADHKYAPSPQEPGPHHDPSSQSISHVRAPKARAYSSLIVWSMLLDFPNTKMAGRPEQVFHVFRPVHDQSLPLAREVHMY